MPYPNGLPSDYSQSDEVLRHAERFAKETGIAARISFGHHVEEISTAVDTGIIHVRCATNTGKHTVTARGVFIATGAQTKRREVTFPNESSFNGTISYGSGNEVNHLALKGQRVVVVGGGAFAVEQTRAALLAGAEHVTVVARSGMTCIPRLADFWRTTGGKIGDILEVIDNMKEWSGFKEMLPFRSSHRTAQYNVSDFMFLALQTRKATVLSNTEVLRVEPDGVIVTCGEQHVACTAIIKCTGYHIQDLSSVYPSFQFREGAFLNGCYNIAFYCDPVGRHPEDEVDDIDLHELADLCIPPGSNAAFYYIEIVCRMMAYLIQSKDRDNLWPQCQKRLHRSRNAHWSQLEHAPK